MKIHWRVRAVLALSALWAGLACAHHSAAQFDFTKAVELQGVVKSIRVINPHTSLTLTVTDERGTRDIEFEGHSVNNFFRGGWRENMVKVGDKIKVTVAPRRDGQDGGFVNSFVTADGKVVGFVVPGRAGAASDAKETKTDTSGK